MSDPPILSEHSLTNGDIAKLVRDGEPVELVQCKLLGVDFTDTTVSEINLTKWNLGLSQLQKISLRETS